MAFDVNISQHLTVLRHAGIVNFAQDDAQRYYYVSRPKLVSTVIDLRGNQLFVKSRPTSIWKNIKQKVAAVDASYRLSQLYEE